MKTQLSWKKVTLAIAMVILFFPCFPVSMYIWQEFNAEPDVLPIPFESEAWKRGDTIGDNRTVRSQMIDDLLQRHDFHGWSKEQIIDLLGNPGEGENHVMYPLFDMAYTLGLEREGWASVDFEYLVFKLNDQQKVIHFRVMLDG
ncbi:MAG: hypothetical protein IID46_12320 [Planctomycetes bacterium]|nr:hypothetical protein [Planctomycetota bacterium]